MRTLEEIAADLVEILNLVDHPNQMPLVECHVEVEATDALPTTGIPTYFIRQIDQLSEDGKSADRFLALLVEYSLAYRELHQLPRHGRQPNVYLDFAKGKAVYAKPPPPAERG